MSIPNHILEQLNSQADLISIIGRHTTLKRAGSEYKGCCPFHGEKSPSFYVNPQKNIYHCFGCSVGGNAISFLRDYENLTFIEAVNELSKQTGIEVPKEEQQNVSYQRAPVKPKAKPVTKPRLAIQPTTSAAAMQPQAFHSQPVADNLTSTNLPTADMQPPTYNDNTYPPAWLTSGGSAAVTTALYDETSVSDKDGNLYELLEQIQQFYQHNLTTHPHAKHYFLSRGITEDIFEAFGLGYAPFGWQHLEHQFPQDIEGLKALGLVRQSESGRDYDLLRDRVI